MYFSKEQDWQKNAIIELSEKYNIDRRVVREISYYPFLFLKRIMKDDYNERPVRFRNLGLFKLRNNKGKQKRLKERLDFILEHSDVWDRLYTYSRSNKQPFKDETHFINYVNHFYKKRSHTLIKHFENKIKLELNKNEVV